MTAEIVIESGDLALPEVQQLLAAHLADMRATSPICSVHALDRDGLSEPGVTFWVARVAGAIVGCAALKQLDARHGEIKSMRTVEHLRGRGLGSMLVEHLLAEARRRGYTRLSLETGSQEFFEPARRVYARHGFAVCEPFADYEPDPASVFMTLALEAPSG